MDATFPGTGNKDQHRVRKIDSTLVLILFGVFIEIGLVVLLFATGIYRGDPKFALMYWLPFTIYLACVYWVSRKKENLSGSRQVAIIIAFSILFNLTVMLSPQPLSDDVYRYHWDGRVVEAGINPYQYSPLDEEVTFLRDADWEKIQNKDVKTMYPPISILVFLLVTKVFPGIFGLRIVSVIFCLLSTWVLVLILREVGYNDRNVLIFSWSPLVVLEFSNSAHIDSLAILLLLVSFYAYLKQKFTASAFSLALAFLSKMFPLFFAPLFLRKWKINGVLVFSITIILAYLPFLNAGGELFSGASNYFRLSMFNSSLFVGFFLGFKALLGTISAMAAARFSIWILIFGFILYLSYRANLAELPAMHVWKYSYWIVGAYLVLTPTLHPWYLTWILPFLCFFYSPGWILLTGTSILARSVYVQYEVTGVWRDLGLLSRAVEYLPVYTLFIVSLIQRKRERFFQAVEIPSKSL